MSLPDRHHVTDHPFDRRMKERRANHYAPMPQWVYMTVVIVLVVGVVVHIAQAMINS